MEFEQIIQLIDHVSDSKLTSFQYEGDNIRLSMKCGQKTKIIAAPTELSGAAMTIPVGNPMSLESVSQAETAPVSEKEPEGNVVKSPLVGTFYATPAEDADPFVKVGDKVKKGQVLAIVEAMKLMNEIESDFDGEVAETYVKNGQAVEYGQPLFRIV